MKTLRRWYFWHILLTIHQLSARIWSWSDDAMMAMANDERPRTIVTHRWDVSV